MALVYHGTNTNRGILIARSGAILSNLEKRIEWLKKLYREQPSRSFENEYPGKTMEQIALEIESNLYGKHEIEARVKCISVVKIIEPTKRYAMRSEDGNGGLILGIDLDVSYIESLGKHYGNPDIRFVPGRLSIDKLREIHLSPIASGKYESLIRQEFKKYRPQYFTIE